MAGRRHDQPHPLRAFGAEVRRYREQAGLTQIQLQEKSAISSSHISKIERGDTRCNKTIAGSLDEVLDARGALCSLWTNLVKDAAYPTWFDWPVIEGEAVHIEAYECIVVYGLLQTEDYASAILVNADEVGARMGRQEILRREDPLPPRLVVLLTEAVLTNMVGSKEIMREQCQYLLDMASSRITIQIVPSPLAPAGTSGAFSIATLADRSEVAYVETPARGFTLSEATDIQTLSDDMADIRARALPVGQSKDYIRRAMEERWT